MKNSVQLIGNVGNDPEIQTLENGNKMVYLNIATNDRFTDDKGEKVEQTEWHRVIAWGKIAETIEKYVAKGKEIGVEGKLTHRSYEDKNGEKKFITEVVVHELLLLSKQ
jgi:single-strand DNA-binding protein